MDMMSYLMGQNSAIKKGMHVEVVTELPTTGVSNVVYLVPKQDTGDNDIFDEYLWVDDDWEHIGSTDIDLSNYYTKGEVDYKFNIPTYKLEISYRIWKNSVTNLTETEKMRLQDILQYNYDNNIDYFAIYLHSEYDNTNAIVYSPTKKLSTKPSGAANGYYMKGDLYIDSMPQSTTTKATGRTIQLRADLSWNDNVVTISAAAIYETEKDFMFYTDNYLAKDNTTSFTPTSDYNPATKKYVDDNKGQTIQYSTMPTADSTTVGKIVQYTGTTDANYTNGYFYIGATDGEATPTYSWENLNVQNGGSGINKYEINITSDVITPMENATGRQLNQADKNAFANFIAWANNQSEDYYLQINLINQPANKSLYIPYSDTDGMQYKVTAYDSSDVSRDYYNVYTVKYHPTSFLYKQYMSINFIIPANMDGYYNLRDKNGQLVQGGVCAIATIRLFYRFSDGYAPIYTYADMIGQRCIERYINRYGLGRENTLAYTPTTDYHPATKKYVDDSIASAITDALGGSY